MGHRIICAVLMAAISLGCTKPQESAPAQTPAQAWLGFTDSVRRGESDRVLKFCSSTKQGEDAVVLLARIIGECQRFEEATKQRWGPNALEGQSLTQSFLPADSLDGEPLIEGDRATVRMKSGKTERFQKVGGGWKYSFQAEEVQGDEKRRLESAMEMPKKMNEVTQQVGQGAFASPQDAIVAIVRVMQQTTVKSAASVGATEAPPPHGVREDDQFGRWIEARRQGMGVANHDLVSVLSETLAAPQRKMDQGWRVRAYDAADRACVSARLLETPPVPVPEKSAQIYEGLKRAVGPLCETRGAIESFAEHGGSLDAVADRMNAVTSAITAADGNASP